MINVWTMLSRYGGASSSGGNTPQSAHDASTSPRVYPTHYPDIPAPSPADNSNPATPASPATPPPSNQSAADGGGGEGNTNSNSPRE